MAYRLQGTHTVTTDAMFETLEGAQKHAADIAEVGTDVALTIKNEAGDPQPLVASQ